MPTPRITDPHARASIDHNQQLIDSISSHAIYMLDSEGFIASWNTGAERMTGFAPAECLGQHFSKLFLEADRMRGLPLRLIDTVRRERRFEVEGWRIRKDGSRFWALSVLETVVDPGGGITGFAEVTSDITERHAALRALQESERGFRLLVQGVIDYAICMLDPSGIVINWNAGGERITGYPAQAVLGQHFSKFHTPEDRAAGQPFRALETATRDGRFEGEGWRVRRDGSRFCASVVIDAIYDETGTLLGFAEITRDITERLAAQRALHDSERQFRLLVASVTDYALFMLDRNGIVTSWNAGAQQIKGYLPHEIIGQHFSRFYTEQDRAAGKPTHSLLMAANDGRFESEGWRVRKDGTLFWANVVIDAVHDDTGRLIGFAKITRDVTERRASQQALQHAQDQLAHAQKMEALGQLTGGVAHDFNNLLTIVTGQAQILRRRIGDNSAALRAVDAIERAAQRGAGLTQRLLAFSRRQHLRPEPIDLRMMADSLRTLLSSSLSGDIRLVTLIGASVWPILADPGELELAIVNLALNARDAMPQGGTITLMAENVTLDGTQRDLPLRGDFVAIGIADTGQGIPEDLLQKVFDPFFTTKPVDKGTGLGLSQVHGFAHQSGGTVAIASRVGEGTRVTLYLPRAATVPVPAAPPAELLEVPTARILVVEDNPDVAPVTAGMLEELGHQTEVVHSAAAALERLAQDSRFDLLLSDIVMAGMDGIALANTVRERCPDLPVVLITGYSRQLDMGRLDWPVLRKPVQLADLSRAVAGLLARPRRIADDAKLVDLRTARHNRHSRSGGK